MGFATLLIRDYKGTMGPELRTSAHVEFTGQLPSRQQIHSHLGFTPEKILVIVDARVKHQGLRSWLKQFGAVYWVKGGEKLKDLMGFPTQAKAMVKKFGSVSPHNCAVMAVGGGTVGDFAGFFASVFKRGVPFIQVPTTFLAAVDSAHGGKNGLNLNGVKNQIGTFHHPRVVYIVHDLLATLPERQRHAAIGEVAKMALLCGGDLFANLAEIKDWDFASLWSLLPTVIAAKYRIVESDPFEITGERQLLNLGHTMGHALEMHYDLEHGFAVGLGLAFAAGWSYHRGYLMHNEYEAIGEVLHHHLAIDTVDKFLQKRKRMTRKKLSGLLADDKKLINKNNLSYVFLEGIGRPRRVSVPLDSLLTEAQRQGWAAR
jgi:3-dehydroquinate synthase